MTESNGLISGQNFFIIASPNCSFMSLLVSRFRRDGQTKIATCVWGVKCIFFIA